MKPLTPLLALMLILVACAPSQFAGTNKKGPYVWQFGGFGHKMKGGVQKAKHGAIELEQILEEPDGVAAVDAVGGAVMGIKAVEGYFKNDGITRKADGKAKVKGTKDPNVIPKDPNVIPEDPNVIPENPNQ